MNRKKVLVFGGTGFIGSAIVDLLMAQPEKYEVWILVRGRFDARKLEHAKVIRGTIERFDLQWLDIIKPDLIFHLARISGRRSWGRNRAATRGKRANDRLIKGIKSSCPDAHVIYVSGTLMYGDRGDKEVDEDCDLEPIAYAREYIHAETPWLKTLRDGNLKVSMMRPPWILGSQSWFGSLYLNYINKHKLVPYFGKGDNWMSIIDLEDCAGLIVHYAESEITNSIFNVSNPNGLLKMRDFVELIPKRDRNGSSKLHLQRNKISI